MEDLLPGLRLKGTVRNVVEFGAFVDIGVKESGLLHRSQTSKGQNVLQKGYSATSSQYKLQIDGTAGRPSCVLVDIRNRTIRLVRSTLSVADGAWHTVQCRRVDSRFGILVDGRMRGIRTIPATLTVANTHPLSIGGKGVYADNDQYHGAVDDVFVRIG